MNVIVDDRDSLITYSPAWATTDGFGNTLGKALEFAGTTSHPPNQNAVASFTFTGTSVSVYGTIGTPHQSTLAFSIDGGPPQNVYLPTPGASLPHYQAFQANGLSDTAHTLTITNTDALTSTFFLDYIMYTASSRSAGQTQFIDSGDSVVSFSDRWNQNNTDSFFMQTSRATDTTGTSVTVKMDFLAGDIFSLHGPLTATPGLDVQSPLVASVSIDGSSSSLPSTNAPTEGTTAFNQNLYTSPQLTAGEHTIVLTYNGGTPLGVDYFLVHGGSGTPSSGSSGAAGAAGPATKVGSNSLFQTNTNSLGGTRTSSGQNALATAGADTNGISNGSNSSQANGSTTPTAQSGASHSSSLPIIIGAAVGGAALLLVLLAIFCFRRRARKQRRTEDDILASQFVRASDFPSVPNYIPRPSAGSATSPTSAYPFAQNNANSGAGYAQGPVYSQEISYYTDAPAYYSNAPPSASHSIPIAYSDENEAAAAAAYAYGDDHAAAYAYGGVDYTAGPRDSLATLAPPPGFSVDEKLPVYENEEGADQASFHDEKSESRYLSYVE